MRRRAGIHAMRWSPLDRSLSASIYIQHPPTLVVYRSRESSLLRQTEGFRKERPEEMRGRRRTQANQATPIRFDLQGWDHPALLADAVPNRRRPTREYVKALNTPPGRSDKPEQTGRARQLSGRCSPLYPREGTLANLRHTLDKAGLRAAA